MNENNPFKIILEKQKSGREIVYIPNPGNLGDSMICAATLQMFDELSIKYINFTENFQHKSSFYYVYGGGGALNTIYIEHVNFLNQINQFVGDLIILPHSFFGIDDFLLGFKGELIVFAREYDSFNYLSRICDSSFQYYIYDDIAIHLNLNSPLLSQYQYFNSILSSIGDRTTRRLNAFRTDQESKSVIDSNKIANNFDLSNMWPDDPFLDKGFYWHWVDPAKVYSSTSWFLNCINIFTEIHTDRLHIGIAACLLGKKVFLYDNSYGKVKAVYEYSLRKNISFDVTFVENWK